jgi:molybdate transport system ATP-binding protein
MADEINVDIEKRFPTGAVIRAKFRIQLTAGPAMILFGPSGSGKTTVLRCIAGLERPDRGVIQFRDEVWFDGSNGIWRPPKARRVGLLFQEYALFPHLTVRQNIEYGLEAYGEPARRRITAEIMQQYEIAELGDRRPREISGGQAQRVALARAVAPQPRILLLDEPLAALDLPTRTRVRAELRRTLERLQVPSLVVTHDRTDAISLGHQIVVMMEGEVRQSGQVEEIFRRPATAAVAGTVGVETIQQGSVVEINAGLARIQVGTGQVFAIWPRDWPVQTRVLVCIRAEDVTLQQGNPVRGSARNHLLGRIEAVESDGAVERVSVDCGFPLVAVITANARQEMGLKAGGAVTAVVKATAVHLIRL